MLNNSFIVVYYILIPNIIYKFKLFNVTIFINIFLSINSILVKSDLLSITTNLHLVK